MKLRLAKTLILLRLTPIVISSFSLGTTSELEYAGLLVLGIFGLFTSREFGAL